MPILLALATSLLVAQTPSLQFTPAAGWMPVPVSSSMRLADFTLPRAEGDTEDGTLTVYYFGGSGGSVQANLDRWVEQMTQPDGRMSKDVARTSTLQSSKGLPITLVDVAGTYVAEVTPGSPERFNKPGFRQMAAVITTRTGPHFVKLVGPAATVARWEPSFRTFLSGLGDR